MTNYSEGAYLGARWFTLAAAFGFLASGHRVGAMSPVPGSPESCHPATLLNKKSRCATTDSGGLDITCLKYREIDGIFPQVNSCCVATGLGDNIIEQVGQGIGIFFHDIGADLSCPDIGMAREIPVTSEY